MEFILDVPEPIHAALLSIGAVVAAVVAIFTETVDWIRTDPKSFDRAIALELIMFTLTTVTLGTFFQSMQRRYERRLLKAEEKRKELILGPFRQMLVSRIASTHAGLWSVLTQYDSWNVKWGRPRIRTIAGGVAAISAELSTSLLSHLHLLQEDEQTAAGMYSQRIFALQTQFEEIEAHLPTLDGLAVGKLQGIIREVDTALVGIANAFEEEYRDRLNELRWDRDDQQALTENLIAPLEEKVRRNVARAQSTTPPREQPREQPQAALPQLDAAQ
jgi:hypothetical protein